MGDARRAGCDRKKLDMAGSRSRRICGLRPPEFAVLLVIDELQEFFLCACLDEGFLEVRIHDHRGELAQDGKMLIVGRIRRRDHEEKAGRLVVHGLEVHALRYGHRRALYARALGVGRCNAVAETRGAGGFTRQHILFVLLLVGEVAGGLHEVCQLIDG